jgi:hypothetical protein
MKGERAAALEQYRNPKALEPDLAKELQKAIYRDLVVVIEK